MSMKSDGGGSVSLREMMVTEQERELIEHVRKIGSGEERVVVQDSRIVEIEDGMPSEGDFKLLSTQEQKIIEIVRELDYGEERVVVKDSEIVQIEEKKSIKL